MRRLFLFTMLTIAVSANPMKQYILNVMTQGMDPVTRYLMQGTLGADLLDMDTGGQRGSRYGSTYPAPYMPQYVPQYITQYVPLYVPEYGPQYPLSQSPQPSTMVPPAVYPPSVMSQLPSESTLTQTSAVPSLPSNAMAPQPPTPSVPVAPQPPLSSSPMVPHLPLPSNPVAPQPPLLSNAVAPQPPLPSIPVAPQPPQLPSAVPPSSIINNQINSNTVSGADKTDDNPYSPMRGSAGPAMGAMAQPGAGNLLLSPSAVPPQRYAAARHNSMANRFVDGFFTFKAMEGMDMI